MPPLARSAGRPSPFLSSAAMKDFSVMLVFLWISFCGFGQGIFAPKIFRVLLLSNKGKGRFLVSFFRVLGF